MIIKQHLQTVNTSGKNNTCEYVCIHHTATGYNTIKGVLKTLTVSTGDKAVSCHYVVDTNGDIYKINEDKDILWHAGPSERKGKKFMNQYSIGIEVIGPLPGFTDEQRKSVEELVRFLQKEHKIDHKNILRHADVSPGRKVDIDLSFCKGLSREQRQDKFKLNNDKESQELEKKKRELIEQNMKNNSELLKICSEATKKVLEGYNNYFKSAGFGK